MAVPRDESFSCNKGLVSVDFYNAGLVSERKKNDSVVKVFSATGSCFKRFLQHIFCFRNIARVAAPQEHPTLESEWSDIAT